MRNKKICADVTRVLTVIFAAAFAIASGTQFDTMSEPSFTTDSRALDAGELHVWSTPLITDFPSV